MSIPNPAVVKKLVDARKAQEVEKASEEKKTTLSRNSRPSSPRSKKEIISSPKDGMEKASGSLTQKKLSSTTPSASTTSGKPIEKKKFERPDRLTQRPLRNHPGLQAMLDSRPNDTRVRREIEKVTREIKQQSRGTKRNNKENN